MFEPSRGAEERLFPQDATDVAVTRHEIHHQAQKEAQEHRRRHLRQERVPHGHDGRREPRPVRGL